MGFKRKFEIGDTVRVKDSKDSFYKKIGIVKGYSDKYDSYTYKYISDKKVYHVDFGAYSTEFYPYQLEKVEDSNNTNTKSNKLLISDLKPGMKVRIRPDLKEGSSKQVYVVPSMANLAGTIQIIEDIQLNGIYLKNQTWVWASDCFSEIVEEPKEEVKTSEKVEFPLKEGQIVTLLDGKKYQVINKKDFGRCALCSLGYKGSNNCSICYINGVVGCSRILPKLHYFKLVEDNKKENKSSSESLTISDFKVEKGNADESINSINSVENSPVKEIGIITKVNFTLIDFKLEKLEHSKFTIL